MSLAIATKIARRELRGGLHGFKILLACLTLGIAAIAAVGTVRESIRQGLDREGATILGGDAEIELSYRRASPQERLWMKKNAAAVSEILDFRSMAVVEQGNRSVRGLTQIKAVDQAYPLLGSVLLEPEMALRTALAGQNNLPGAVMDRVLVERLGLQPGGVFRLGTQEFVLMAILQREPDSATGAFTLGPRTIVRSEDLAQSGLLQPGTLFESAYRLEMAAGTDLDELRRRADGAIAGGGFRWRDRRDGAPGVTEFVERLSTFLILVGLAGLAVGGVGVSTAVRAYMDDKIQVIATLKTLGAAGRTIFLAYLLQIGVLTAFGIGLGLLIGGSLPLILAPVIEANLPVPVVLGIHPRPLAEAAIYGVLAATLFTIWPLARASKIRAAALYRDASLGLTGLPSWPYIVFCGLVLGLLIAAAVIFSGNLRLSLWVSAGLFASFLALMLMAFLVRRLARWLARVRLLRSFTSLRMALGSIGGPGNETGSVVLSLGLGLAVLATVGQIDANLRGAIARDMPDRAPSFFVVDIQADQLSAYLERVNGDAGVSRVQTAPMLRGVITRINDRPAADVVGDHWVITGDRGITYSASMPQGTVIEQGAWWPEDYTGPPQISFAATEAAEMGLALGDTMTVNVLGRDITATITSFREVDFSSAGMGFILSMNPAAIAAAPHTFISTIYATRSSEAGILRDLADDFPNITMISVGEAIKRISELLGNIAAAITYGALVTLLTGVVVLIGAAAAGEQARTYEAAVLKTLGATRRAVLANFLIRSAILGAAASAVAIATGAIAGWAVIVFVMHSEFTFEFGSAMLIVTGGTGVTLLAGFAFSYRSLSARPSEILQANE